MAKPIVRKITGTVQGFNPGEEVPKLANDRPVRIHQEERSAHNVRENVT